jgi:hypothetical protein
MPILSVSVLPPPVSLSVSLSEKYPELIVGVKFQPLIVLSLSKTWANEIGNPNLKLKLF